MVIASPLPKNILYLGYDGGYMVYTCQKATKGTIKI